MGALTHGHCSTCTGYDLPDNFVVPTYGKLKKKAQGFGPVCLNNCQLFKNNNNFYC